jgi:hypothetical protein
MNVVTAAQKTDVNLNLKVDVRKTPGLLAEELKALGPVGFLAGTLLGPNAAPIGGIETYTSRVLM